ncbi:MAG: DNA-binding protein [Candidatus Staskawiczbacteria bacterium RIFOXYB2_FULL_32_9]|uniref:DNA-binding protein n=1 Tax=Candidatus Staskawiczbacteria bacterium RIFOXYD1_FULL_32_13 TaxID=1802234 RepID=A0A1G2JMH1_9BACT|nr:MAG: KilA-N, DNA-binding domain protein [Parcubacteria group bacterium GW2011_GWC2_32_10]OGZ78640.1 MAG: DNA-binding protein [Candidatus Staskawiczbacteria bacterium RIFOXYA2_FULL_32_7]OGZ79313.1 MAG: DNA-binding protein [Candidatus Staskawiczbacteria bacterium RIFOXYB1_FULL_32_11]OGZ80984.1 MAG: DNA-binding protein [Candidatus Staskawiczbacteria bacterium RIFOXYB2_FULL_32_9]OGZ88055.1 MAG: DNA-binding protein [Candidatus Staskawiczbacteria bacterium RIFOXYC2_FULL_32_10]OGZ88346.1 MAG: DNA-
MSENLIIPSEIIVSKIYIIRNKKVMLDRDIAELYDVKTSTLNQAVKRNIDRFPEDFMFQLNKEEVKNWMSQIVISKSEKMGLRKLPLAFTEQGVAMLSGVLKSKKAVKVNIQIMRTFMKIRELLATNESLQRKIMEMENKYDSKIKSIFNILGLLLDDEKSKKNNNKLGFTK